ncbi:MAG: RsmE family RNA methyltransferase [Anaerolineae bacterium]
MQRHRFFVPPEWLAHDPISLSGEVAHQLCRVLRLKPGDEIELLDNSGRALKVRLTRVEPRECLALRQESYRPCTEPRVPMVLYQSLPKGRKMDTVLQKAVELGATAIAPVLAARSVPAEPDERGGARLIRWRRIIQEAAEQSGRAVLPSLSDSLTLSLALEQIQPGDLCLAGLIEKTAVPIRSVLQLLEAPPPCVRLFVGPEGGFDQGESKLLQEAGAIPVTLGARTLRTETAGLAMLAVVCYALGEMG